MKIIYEIEDRDAVLAQITESGKRIIEDVTIDLVDGRLTNCYCIVVDAPEGWEEPARAEEPGTKALLAEIEGLQMQVAALQAEVKEKDAELGILKKAK